MAKEIILRRARFKELEEQLEMLKTVKRKEIAERIKVARDFGDLSENSEYDEAKNDQAFLEGEINRISEMLKNATIIDDDEVEEENPVVAVGARVTIYDEEFEEELVYELVGATEADMKLNKISTDSPLGAALIGKRAGEKIVVSAPDSDFVYQVLKVER